ncbi:MAG: DUF2228 domain-containing protein [Kofleriaceae bacterium]
MPELQDGDRVVVEGSSGNNYTLERHGDVYSCSCPAWRNQKLPIEDRVCKHLEAYLDGKILAKSTARPDWVPAHTDPPDVAAARRAALAEAIETFPVAYDKMLAIYDLRMPKHLAYAIGFWNGLQPEERDDAWNLFGTGPMGVGEFFQAAKLERKPMYGLDERLDGRFRKDPPEMVTVFSGNGDGNHYGLWYDEPGELPRTIVHNYARDEARTYMDQPTLLGTFRDRIYNNPHGHPEGSHLGAVIGWLEEAFAQELAVYREEKIGPVNQRADSCGGFGPYVPSYRAPTPFRDKFYKPEGRIRHYEEHSAEAENWIAKARRELADGKPGFALLVAHDLHWVDDDGYRGVCSELMFAAYKALGREALFQIAHAHYAHRELRSVDVYSPSVLSEFEQAVVTNDAETVARLASPDTVKDLHVVSPLLELMIPHAKPWALADAVMFHYEEMKYSADRAPHEHAFELLLARGIDGNVFESLLQSKDETLIEKAWASVDLAWRDPSKRTLLHIMCLRGNVEGVRTLLERGADGNAVDAKGETPYGAVAHIWTDHRKEADAIYALLRAKGFAPKPQAEAKPAAVVDDFREGDKVTHVQLGEGVVKVTVGRGPLAKISVLFPGKGVQTIAAKFLKKA